MSDTKLGSLPSYRREIASGLKSRKVITCEAEHPVRWSFMKVLREHSDLKQFYPDVDPYAEAYRMRENVWCIYVDSLDGGGDPWIYLIDGPRRAMLIDTGFGLGDLKGLVGVLVGNKPLIVVNTHSHCDHAFGDAQFDTIWCHEAERQWLEAEYTPNAWDYLFDEGGSPRWVDFDRNDLISWKMPTIETFKDGHLFDLGDGHYVEAIPLPGHTPGQCGYLDRSTGAFFIGDVTGIGSADPDDPMAERVTVRALHDAYADLMPRLDEITGVFPGHGALDQSPLTLRYQFDALEAIMANPERYDDHRIVVGARGLRRDFYLKYIYQGTAIRYTMKNVG